jgi:hypothetical protein
MESPASVNDIQNDAMIYFKFLRRSVCIKSVNEASQVSLTVETAWRLSHWQRSCVSLVASDVTQRFRHAAVEAPHEVILL